MTIEILALAFMAVVAVVFAALYLHSMSKKKELELTVRFEQVERGIWENMRSVREELQNVRVEGRQDLRNVERHIETMNERFSRIASNSQPAEVA
jgi:SMC interacting uncharacterized protein involved in chromosome segregation